MDRQLLSAYLPMDRRQALARKEVLSERTSGSVIFADVSGFTPLTESLVNTLGARLGAEELARYLSMIYDALIAEVDRYHGSVIDFSGDAITCWFDLDSAALLATACAFGMQQAMQPFSALQLRHGEVIALAVKTAVASGPVRRFVVGDPAIQRIDVIAGRTLLRMAAGEHNASKGEVILDSVTVDQLNDGLKIRERRSDQEAGETFAVIDALLTPVEPQPWPPILPGALSEHQIYPSLLAAFRQRLSSGLGEFPSELRPSTALFLRFGGIDYDGDEQAAEKLDRFIRAVQDVLSRYDGILADITIGDKGSYLYGAFGAPVAHEDDVQRAVDAALALVTLPASLDYIDAVQIGISQGTMRTGVVGGKTRRVYSVLGDEVNLAARLMQQAEPGQILATDGIHRATAAAYAWEALPPIQVKGKSAPVPVARLKYRLRDTGESAEYATDLVGRDDEMAQLRKFLEPIVNGQFAGLMAVYGDAGMGKSRVIYELHKQPGMTLPVRWLNLMGEPVLRQSLYPFRQLLRAYFKHDNADSEAANAARFESILSALQASLTNLNTPQAIAQRDALTRRKPFLAALLDLHQDQSAYEQLEPRLRFQNTLLALKAFILAESLLQPVILYVEDAHWLDADSRQMIKLLAQDAAGFPIALLLCSRYGDDGGRLSFTLGADVPQQAVDLNRLPSSVVKTLASQIVGGEVGDDLANFLAEETDGNPLFVEQLALHLWESGVLRQEAGVWTAPAHELAEIPIGINAVLVARLDRLTAQVKSVVQMAAVLGHEFEVQVLSRMLKDDAQFETKMKQAEAQVIWSARSDVVYLFRHTLLREAAYDMQLEARLRELHALAGNAIETIYALDLSPHAAALAHHYRRAEDLPKERQYARMAGMRAAVRFANAEAITYLDRALELADSADLDEHYTLLQTRERIFDRLGTRQPQRADLDAMQAIAERLDDDHHRAEVALRRANLAAVTGDYPAALLSAQRVVSLAQNDHNGELEALGHLQWGDALLKQTDYPAATGHIQQAVKLVQTAQLHDLEADSFQALGVLALHQNDYASAENYLDNALRLDRQLGDRQKEAGALNALGMVAYERGDNDRAQILFEQALQLSREIADRIEEDAALHNLGMIARDSRDLAAAHAYDEQALQLSQDIEDPEDRDLALLNLGQVVLDQGNLEAAESYDEQALDLSRQLGNRQEEAAALCSLGQVSMERTNFAQAQRYFEHAMQIARDTRDARQESITLIFLGELALHQGDSAQAQILLDSALRIAKAIQAHPQEARAHTLLDQLAATIQSSDEK